MKKRKPIAEELALLDRYTLPHDNACVLMFDADEEVFRQGAAIRWFMLILKGSADIQVHAPNGGKLSFGYSMDSGTLGEVELLSGSLTSTTTVVAMSPFECLAIPFEQAKAEIQRNIRFCHMMGESVARDFSDLESRYTVDLLSSGEQRLAAYLLRKQRAGVFRGTLSDAASIIGVSYRHIFRMMSRLCEQGVLSKENDGYHILDPEALTALST